MEAGSNMSVILAVTQVVISLCVPILIFIASGMRNEARAMRNELTNFRIQLGERIARLEERTGLPPWRQGSGVVHVADTAGA